MNPEILGPLRSLARAYQTALLYPDDHPAVPRSAEQAHESLTDLLSRYGSLPVRVGRDRLRIGDEEVQGDPGSPIQSLNTLLYDLEASLLQIENGVSLGELRDLIRNLARARRNLAPGRKLLRSLGEGELEHVRLLFLDYDSLAFQEGAREGSEEPREEDLWLGLHRLLTKPPEGSRDPGPEALARQVSAELALREGTGIGLLRDELRKAQQALQELPGEDLSVARQRVTKFLRALSPDVRSDLLRVHPRHPEAPLALLSEFAEDLPSSEVLESLQAIDRLEGPVPELLVSLLTKLVRLSESRSSLESGLQQCFKRWGLTLESTRGPQEDLREALAEVLQRRGELSPNPESYSELLEELSREDGGVAGAFSSKRLYRDPESETGVLVQAAEISAHLLMEADRTDYRHGLLACLGSAADAILEQENLQLMALAARRAEELGRRPGESEGTRRAARGLLDDFRDREKMNLVATAADRLGQVPHEAVFLLGLGGAHGIEAAIDALERSSSPALTDGYREFIQSQPTDLLAEVVSGRAGTGSRGLRVLISLTDQLPVADAVPILEKLFEDEDPELRRAALDALGRREKKVERLEGPLRSALRDLDQRVADKAIELLTKLEGEVPRRLLSEFLEESAHGETQGAPWARRAAERLIHGGAEAGRARLLSILEELRWSLGKEKVRMAATIAEILSPFAGHPQIRQGLRRFERSPAGLLARLRATRGRPAR